MGTVKAAVCREFGGPLTIEEVTLADPGPGEVEVEIAACAICFSDISFMDGGWGGHLPAVYGHEAAGIITRMGDGVRDYSVGDTVLVTLIKSCGSCRPCLDAHPAACSATMNRVAGHITQDGETFEQGMNAGAFAEKAVVDQSQIVAIPPDLPMDSACLLSCGVITGIGAVVNAAGVRPGQNVVVIGAGGVGLNAIQGARIAGAAHIIAVDMTKEKLAAATEFGATGALLANGDRPWDAARKIMGRGADAVFVTVGAIPAFEVAARYLDSCGRVYMVGMPHNGEAAHYEPAIASALSQGMIGTKMGDAVLRRDIPWMIDLYRQGRLRLDELVSGRWQLEEINEAIADTRTGAARRNVIVFRPPL